MCLKSWHPPLGRSRPRLRDSYHAHKQWETAHEWLGTDVVLSLFFPIHLPKREDERERERNRRSTATLDHGINWMINYSLSEVRQAMKVRQTSLWMLLALTILESASTGLLQDTSTSSRFSLNRRLEQVDC
jgi:hypothetical protein